MSISFRRVSMFTLHLICWVLILPQNSLKFNFRYPSSHKTLADCRQSKSYPALAATITCFFGSSVHQCVSALAWIPAWFSKIPKIPRLYIAITNILLITISSENREDREYQLQSHLQSSININEILNNSTYF